MAGGQIERQSTERSGHSKGKVNLKKVLKVVVPTSLVLAGCASGGSPSGGPTPMEISVSGTPLTEGQDFIAATSAATNTPTSTPTPARTESPTAIETVINPFLTQEVGTEIPSAIPTIATLNPTATHTETPVPTATLTNRQEITQYLEGLGIDVMIPRADWPTTGEEVAAMLDAGHGNSIDAEHLVRIMDLDTKTNTLVWHGWWMGEPAFPLQEGISYDSNLHVHIDTKTNQPIFDPLKIFKSYDQLSDAEKANFNQNLVDVKINQNGIAVFARKGENLRAGDPETEKNNQYFFGTMGSEVDGVEQLSLIPVEQELCITDVELSGAVRSFRQASLDLRDNPDTRSGRNTVKWFNPETKTFDILDGRMIAEIVDQYPNTLSILEQLPANTPLSPEDMAERFGGKAANWIVEPSTWEWHYEAFNLKAGVHYVPGVGLEDASGKLLIGAKQADRSTTEAFDFDHVDQSALVKDVKSPQSLQALLFARQGTVGDPATNNHSWYTFGDGEIHLTQPGIEQMTMILHNPAWCAPVEIPQLLAEGVKGMATSQPDAAVTAIYWTGTQWITVTK